MGSQQCRNDTVYLLGWPFFVAFISCQSSVPVIFNLPAFYTYCLLFYTEDADEFLKIRFTRLSEVKVEALDVDTAQLHFQSFKANLHTGTIDIDPRDNTVCESIALILSISVLHVLCAPENTERRMKSKSGTLL